LSGMTDIRYETSRCLVCGHAENETLFYAPDRFYVENGYPFHLARCSQCDFRFLNPRPEPESISNFYQEDGYQPFLSQKEKKSLFDKTYDLARIRMLLAKRKKVEKFQKTGEILDVGCGTGEFLNEMKKNDWRAFGVELNADAASYARKRYNLEVSASELSECCFADARFDVITLWHALEHFHQPKDSLLEVKRILKKQGVVIVAMPNIDSLDSKFYREHWIALDSPRHLSHFSPRDMQRISLDVGLELIDIQQLVLDAYYNCLLSEMLLAKIKKVSKLLLPGLAARAATIASISVLNAGKWRKPEARQGSSNIYFLKHRRAS